MATGIGVGSSLIRRFEGCRLKAYRCPAGVLTIGWGHTSGVRAGMVWTQEHADTVLDEDLKVYERGVLDVCPSIKNRPYRLGACISLAYNIGVGAFRTSSVCKYINAGLYQKAADSFLLWKKAGGVVLQGLVNRRNAERTEFLKDGVR